MPNPVAHFAIHADDCQRAKRFYEQVFGWSFEPWGPPDFWLINTGGGGPHGSLQQRREPLTGTGMRSFECSISVTDVQEIAASIRRHGGQVLLEPMKLEGVGTLVQFADTEGNVVGAMEYLEQPSFGDRLEDDN